MNLDWQETKSVNLFAAVAGDDTDYVVFYSEFSERADDLVRAAIEECVEKSVSLIDKNIFDESRFLLFEWDAVYSLLTIVVTDECKVNDSSSVVKCFFSALDSEEISLEDESDDKWEDSGEEYPDRVKGWIKEYLTTCPSFFLYSLLAAFHSETRDDSELL